MTLAEMGEEYLRQAAVIREKITQLRKQVAHMSGLELYRTRGDILRLYTIARDLKDTGEYLLNYYEEE